MSTNPDVDGMVVDAVRNVRDRFGIAGLRDLVNLATVELREAERAGAAVSPPETAEQNMADTQAWIAFTGDEFDRA